MKKEIICENTSVELAIADALQKLNATRVDVDIIVLSEPPKGLIWFGKKLAKVKVSVKESPVIPLAEPTLEVSKCSELPKSTILNGLNEKQLEAVKNTEGYIRIIAGAGSGKTKALTHRYAYLVKELGVMPANILCVTFTNKAAFEMKKRIRKMIGDTDLGKIATFHGFCVQLLREDSNIVQYPSKFIVLDEEDIDDILKESFSKFSITSRDYTFNQAKHDIGLFKSNNSYIELLSDPNMKKLNQKRETAETIREKVIYEFIYIQRKTFGLDFDDLINFALYVLQNDESTRIKWQKRLQYVMVDEFKTLATNSMLWQVF